MFFVFSRLSTFSMRLVVVAAPRTGAMRSRHFVTTSLRGIGFAGVPRTASTCSVSFVPSVTVTSTIASRRGNSYRTAITTFHQELLCLAA